jgi:hypothetical protein
LIASIVVLFLPQIMSRLKNTKEEFVDAEAEA